MMIWVKPVVKVVESLANQTGKVKSFFVTKKMVTVWDNASPAKSARR